MPQEKAWDREYKQPKFLVTENKPQADVTRFVRFLKKEFKNQKNSNATNFENLKVLDLGSGTGRNSFYFAELGASVASFEISETAIGIARENLSSHCRNCLPVEGDLWRLRPDVLSSLCRSCEDLGSNHLTPLDIEYKKQSIGEKFPCGDDFFDIVLDVTSSNSLSESEREIYLSETHRVLKNGGYFFVKALCKDGDDNAKNLLRNSPGREVDTYILPNAGIAERVFSRDDFVKIYQKFFTILHLEKKTSYTKMSGRLYKRNFWIGYLRK